VGCLVEPDLLERLRGKRYSQAPVLDENGNAVGIITLANLEEYLAHGEAVTLDSGKVDVSVLPLTTSIGELLSLFSFKSCALVKGENLDGASQVRLLTISDLNKPPLRHFIYKVLFQLETDLAYLIADRIKEPNEWITLLPKGSQVSILGNWEIQKRDDIELAVGPLFSCTMTDLRHVVLGHIGIRTLLGYSNREKANGDLFRIVSMRNRVMHPVRPLVTSIKSVQGLLKTFQGIESVLNRIEAASPTGIEHRLSKVPGP